MISLDILTKAAIAFIFVEAFFTWLGWYTKHESDHLYRKHLDGLWDRLQSLTFYETLHLFFGHLVRRIDSTFSRARGVWPFFVCSSVFINFVCVIGILETYARLEKHESSWRYLFEIGERSAIVPLLVVISAIILLCSLPDIFSLWITWKLILRASRDSSVKMILAHILVDIVLAFTALVWAFLIFAYAEQVLGFFFGRAAFRGATSIMGYLILMLRGLVQRPGLAVAIVLLGLNSALPTVLYLVTGIILLMAYLAPDRVRRVVSRILFLVTTDDKPIFGQLGRVCGVTAALLAALMGVVGRESPIEARTQVAEWPEDARADARSVERTLDAILRRDSINWGFRTYEGGSVHVTSPATKNFDVLAVRGKFIYREFGVPSEIECTANVEKVGKIVNVSHVCWRTLGGEDCVDQSTH